jgi:4-hydroxybenzoate polyprenyltransferase
VSITWRVRIWGLWAMVHPAPSLITVLAYTLFAVLAAHGHPDPTKLVLTSMGMLGVQFAISALNDYCDRAADAHSHKAKPIARGVLAPRMALVSTFFFTVLTVIGFAPFGVLPLGIATVGLALGFA